MAKRRDPNSAHYIDNKEFLARISEYRESRIEAEESGEERPRVTNYIGCLLYTSPSPRDRQKSRMPSSA